MMLPARCITAGQMIAIICLMVDTRAIFRSKCRPSRSSKPAREFEGLPLIRRLPRCKDKAEIRKMVTIQVNNLIDFVAEVFSHSESSPEEARRIATYLTTANLTGHDSHGVIRVPVYIRWKKTGNVVPNQTPEIVVDTPSLAVVDGKFGYGQTVTPFAVRTGIEKCKKAGLSAVALRNAGHIGRVGDWAEMAAAEGLVSVHFVNAAGSLLVAPFGGVAEAALDRALLRRHSAPGAGSDRARFCHLDRRRRQGAGGKPRRQETADRRAGRCRRHAERGAVRALRSATPRTGRATTPRGRARSARSASTRARGLPSSASCSAAR